MFNLLACDCWQLCLALPPSVSVLFSPFHRASSSSLLASDTMSQSRESRHSSISTSTTSTTSTTTSSHYDTPPTASIPADPIHIPTTWLTPARASWVADDATPACMQCSQEFTLLFRRHRELDMVLCHLISSHLIASHISSHIISYHIMAYRSINTYHRHARSRSHDRSWT